MTTPSSSSLSSSSSGSTRSISLCHDSIAQYTDGEQSGYQLDIRVIEAINITSSIFVYHRYYGTAPHDTFENVASPVDIEEYPISEPVDEFSTRFRLSTVSLVARDPGLLHQSWVDLLQDVSELVNSLNLMDVVAVEDLEIT